mmetsp:Transcript_30626/g.47000  ORF Transcript_30626/g.47000 Transcript_30626/m.47000 type:complete len:122 (-) Transcript_30626:141-506(-)
MLGGPTEVFDVHKSSEEEMLTELLIDAAKTGTEVDRKYISPKYDLREVNVCDYGLILTDCSMPFMDGYECTKCMRTLLRATGISNLEDQPRIVAITGHFEPEYQMKAICSGMEKVFPKPMT